MVKTRNYCEVYGCRVSLLMVIIVGVGCCYVTPTNGFNRCNFYRSSGAYQPSHNVTKMDKDLIEFALNLEYFEAEWFLWCAYGFGLDKVAPKFAKGGPPPIGAQRAELDDFTHEISVQFGLQEVDHIIAISKTVEGFARPLLNLSKGVWETIMNEAFGHELEPPFNPYEDSTKFMLASYMIPYVGLTGYVGANPLLKSPTAKRVVAGLLGVESGQDAIIRMYLYERKDEKVKGYEYTVQEFTSVMSELRNRLGRTAITDEGVVVPKCLGPHNHTTQNVLAADHFSMSYARTPQQILRIIYGTGSEYRPNAFYPTGARGRIAQQYLDLHHH